ncbi:MAG: thioesterase family protein [Pseudomonadales bacterium]|nr:thioesterase family protein [Pseudomonadales bacterium]
MGFYLQETGVTALEEGLWEGHVSSAWNIGENPNGGYLASIALRAASRLTPGQPSPLTATIHYLRPGIPDQSCEIRTELVKPGRTLSVVRASLIQGGKTRLEVLAGFGAIADAAHTAELNIPMPQIPPPDECVERSGDQQGVGLPLLDRLDIRMHPEQAVAGAAGRAEVSGWIRLRDQLEPDPISPVLFADAFPPSVFGLLGAVGWVPTLELTIHCRRPIAQGWVLGRMTTEDLMDGRMIENGCLWDEQGRLIAQSRQLALVMNNSAG